MFVKTNMFVKHICVFDNVGPGKTLDLVEGVLLTPVSSGLDETAVQL